MRHPAVTPQDGPDDNIGGHLLVVIWVLYGITLIVILLRLYTQGKVMQQLGLGDALMTASLLTLTAFVAFLTVQYHYGLGRHFFLLDRHQKVQAMKFSFISQPLGVLSPALGRMATCIMMLQLFGTARVTKRALWIIFWSQLIVNPIICFLIVFQCKNVQTLWDPAGHPGYCWRPLIQEHTGYVSGAFNASADLFLTLMPIGIFWNLRITKSLKFGLGFLLSLSGTAFIASIVRTVLMDAIGRRGDFTYDTVSLFQWVVVEIALVDIAASLPLVLPLVRRFKKPSGYAASEPAKKLSGAPSSGYSFQRHRDSSRGDLEEQASLGRSNQSNGKDVRGKHVERIASQRQPSYNNLDGQSGGRFQAEQAAQGGLSKALGLNLSASNWKGGQAQDAWRFKDLPKTPRDVHTRLVLKQ